MNALLEVVQKAIHEKRGENVLLYDFRSVNPFIEYCVIVTAGSSRQIQAIAASVRERVRENGFELRAIEGGQQSSLVLVDLDSVIVHIFDAEERKRFALEKLYADLPYEDFNL